MVAGVMAGEVTSIGSPAGDEGVSVVGCMIGIVRPNEACPASLTAELSCVLSSCWPIFPRPAKLSARFNTEIPDQLMRNGVRRRYLKMQQSRVNSPHCSHVTATWACWVSRGR